MTPLLAILVILSSVAGLVAALLVAFAIRDARLMLYEVRQTLLLAQHAARHAHPTAPPPTPRKRTTTRSPPRDAIPYTQHHPTPDPAHPHASPYRGDTWAQGTPPPKDP